MRHTHAAAYLDLCVDAEGKAKTWAKLIGSKKSTAREKLQVPPSIQRAESDWVANAFSRSYCKSRRKITTSQLDRETDPNKRERDANRFDYRGFVRTAKRARYTGEDLLADYSDDEGNEEEDEF